MMIFGLLFVLWTIFNRMDSKNKVWIHNSYFCFNPISAYVKIFKNRGRWEDSSFISKVITYHTHYTFKHLKDIQGYTYKWKKQLLNWKLCLIKVSKSNALFVQVKTFRCQQPCTFLHPSCCAEHGICLIESNEYSFSIPKWIMSQGINI